MKRTARRFLPRHRSVTAGLLLLTALTAPVRGEEAFVIPASPDAGTAVPGEASPPDADASASPPVEEIIIQGRREAPDPRSLPGQATILTAEQIAAAAPRDLGDLLEPVLGVGIRRYGGRAAPAFISVRGSSPEQVLILMDGRRLNSAQGGGFDLASIDPASIQRIEIYRGGASALYGGNAVGGVINIVRKEGARKPFGLSASAGAASFSTAYAALTLSGSSGEEKKPGRVQGSLRLSGLTSRGDFSFSDETLGPLTRDNADIRRGSAGASLIWQPAPQWRIEGDGSLSLDERGVPGTVEFPTPEARMEDEREHLALKSLWIGQAGEVSLDASLVRQLRLYQEERHDNLALEAELSFQIGGAGRPGTYRLLGGGSLRRDTLDSTLLISSGGEAAATENLQRLAGALFLRGESRLLPWDETGAPLLTVTPALRTDWLDGVPQPSWKIGLRIALNPDESLILKGNAGSSFRPPSFDDLFWPVTAFAAGNPDLQPETALFGDAGINLSPLPNLSIDLAGFIRQVENLIQWNPGPSGWRPVNIGSTLFRGLEAEIRGLWDLAGLNAWLETTLNGSLLEALDKRPDSSTFNCFLPRKPLWQANLLAVLTHSDGHYLRTEIRGVGPRAITAANTKWFDPYLVIDLSLGWFFNERVSLILSGKNLLNQSYLDLREYPIPGTEFNLEVRYAL